MISYLNIILNCIYNKKTRISNVEQDNVSCNIISNLEIISQTTHFSYENLILKNSNKRSIIIIL